MIDHERTLERSRWGSAIPWFMSISSFAVLLCLAAFLFVQTNSLQEHLFSARSESEQVLSLNAFHSQASFVIRSVGLFAGFALIFIGSAVSFYTLEKGTDIELKGQSLAAKLTTFSPGIVAMLLGTALIIFTIGSKSDFQYVPQTQQPPPLSQPAVPPPK